MIVKKIIYLESSQVLALKYNHEKQLCTIGGHKQVLNKINVLIKEYFNLKKFPKLRVTTRNKYRYTFKYSWEKFINVIDKLENDEINIYDVENHGNIMR